MQPTDNDGSPETSTTPSSGAVWTDEEWERFVQIGLESLREGLRRD